MTKHILTFVSHTHWDREWYQPFEEFRFRLVKLVDKLLHILDTDLDYKFFMLDGQTIVLDDYLAIRPEQRDKIVQYINDGRLLIGPWYILPDEFLVSGEATIRNLLVGGQVCQSYGRRMDVGYIPDTFGHISQMPQILRGFGFDTMVFWRGVSGVKNEFIWQAADGSEVMVIHQRNSYGNAATMPVDEQAFIARTKSIIDGLAPTATTPHLLAMNGTDHVEPMPELPRLLAAADAALPEVEIRHGTLPQFIEAVGDAAPELERRTGEMRDGSRAPILPGVLSTRMWIKQRNHACETLLTAWAEPMAALAELTGAPLSMSGQTALVKQAWRTLMQNHPHDSICGCSVDQVHKEMDVRFDRVEQIGEQVTAACLEALAEAIDTSSEDDMPAVVVFNPSAAARTDLVHCKLVLPKEVKEFVLVDERGRPVASQASAPELDVMWEMTMGAKQVANMVGAEMPQEIMGHGIQAIEPSIEGKLLRLVIRVAQGQPANPDVVQGDAGMLAGLLQSGQIEEVHMLMHRGAVADCTLVAADVPGLGYRTYHVRPVDELPSPSPAAEERTVANEFFQVEVEENGSLTLIDKGTGARFTGLNRFVDVGDRGDEYNFCPVEADIVVDGPVNHPLVQRLDQGATRQTVEVSMVYRVPAGLGETRAERSEEWVDMPITTRVSLTPGVRRVDVETTVTNRAMDHRLRVHIPVPVTADTFDAEGHFDVITRPLDLPQDTDDWVEQPVATHPQRTWASVSDGQMGLMVANRGLPEVEVLRRGKGSEIALTLLRSVGWLSRSDMSVRQGHAGPGLPTPGAQCLDTYTFHYSLIPHSGDWKEGMAEAHGFNLPLRAKATSAHQGILPGNGSFIQVTPPSMVVSAIKEAESGDGLIVRFWNTSEETHSAQVRFWQQPTSVDRCNLAETVLEKLTADDSGAFSVAARGREIVTLLARF